MAAIAGVKSLFGNIVFLATVSSFLAAQLTKMSIYVLSRKHKKIKDIFETAFWRTGGMPSSHSACVSALTTSVGYTEGVSSNMFVICLFFSLVVLRDAVGVRRSAGLQAKALNNLGRQAADKIGVDFHAVKEIQGHTPLEVVVGALLGIFIASGFIFI